MKKRVLVTGGLGFIGSHMVDLLLSEGEQFEVTVMDNLSSESSSRSNMREGVEYWIDDIQHINTYKYADSKFDTVFHIAGFSRIQPSFTDPLTCLSTNVHGTANVLEYARRLGANVVYAGSSSAYAGPMLNPYAYAKYTGEQLCEMYSSVYSMNTAVSRFFNVYGVRQPIVGPYATVVGIFERQKKAAAPLTVTGDGEQRRDFIHVTDIVRGLYTLSQGDHRGEVYNLGTGRNYSINELAKLFNPNEITYIPARSGEARVTLADISKTSAETGWSPRIRLEDYVSGFLRDLKQ
jgi:UDP-glucose 4-epimerase